jgi:hypothetical protein
MKATIVYLNSEYKVITARNNKSLSNKLAKMKIIVSEIDLLFMSMTAGYTQVDSPMNCVKINITTK